MTNELFKDRERAAEANYFRQQDERLLDSLRKRAPLDEIARAIGEKLQVDNSELLERVRKLGLKPETAPALFLAPLVQVAWAEGKISRDEQDAVLRLALDRGVEMNSPPYQQILEWLAVRPSDDVFDTAVEILKYGFAVLPEDEREDRIKRVVEACHEVAAASGGGLAKLLGLGSSVSGVEASMLDSITATLRSA
jgi:tellurite resistance protein